MCSISDQFRRPKFLELGRVTLTRSPEIDRIKEQRRRQQRGDDGDGGGHKKRLGLNENPWAEIGQ